MFMSRQTPGPHDRRSQRDRMRAGDLYVADDPQLAADSLRALELTQQFNESDPSDPSDPQARLAVLRELLGSLGEGSEIRPPLRCDYGYQTHVGARTFINFGVVLLTRDLPASVVAVGNPARVVRPL
jgi:maltose O-acetyltransferase